MRRRILELLREGPTPVGELAARLPVGRPAVSKHLRVLSNAGLIEHRSVGTRNLYLLAPGGMAAAQQWLVRTWDTVLAGQSGIGPITRFDVSAFPVRFGGQVRDFDVAQYMPSKEARRMDDFMHYGVAAGVQAVSDSGIDFSKSDAARCGAICGAGIGGLDTIETEYGEYLKAMSPRKISPFFVPASIINMIAGHLSIRYGLKGPNLGIVTACTTSTHAIGLGMRTIQYGDADVILAGGGEMATTRRHCRPATMRHRRRAAPGIWSATASY